MWVTVCGGIVADGGRAAIGIWRLRLMAELPFLTGFAPNLTVMLRKPGVSAQNSPAHLYAYVQRPLALAFLHSPLSSTGQKNHIDNAFYQE